jgi:hypothetical protein
MYLLMADTDVGYLWNAETNGALVLGTGGAERARITPAGKFGIGTNSPAHQLEVVGPASVTVGVSAGGSGFAELELVGQAGKNYITSDDTLSFDIGGTERATVGTTGLNVTSGTLSQGGTAVSLSTHTHAYQPAGTYVTSIAGTAPIVASTTTAGAATVSVSTGTTSATVATGNHAHTQYLEDTGDTLTGALTISNTGSLTVWGATSTAATQVSTRVDGDASTRWGVRADGFQAWGDGTASRDTNLYRSAANTLATDDNFDVGQDLTVGGDIIHASQLDFAAGGAVGASVISSGLYLPPGKTVMFEGTTNNTSEIELTAADATADRTITLPDASGTLAIGQTVLTSSNVTFNQVTASDYIKLSSWNQATAGNDSSADTVTVTTAGTYYAIGGANCEVSFTPDFVGQQFFVTMTGYASLNTTTIQYAFVRVTLTDSSSTLVDTLGYGRADNFGTSGRGSTVAFNQIWTADTTSARKIKLYGTTQTTNGLVLSLAYWQLNIMALA